MIKKINISEKDKEVLESIKIDSDIEINDFFDYSQVVIDKPWGYEYSLFKNNDIDVWILCIGFEHKTSMHCHPHKKTALTVLSGEAEILTFNEKVKLKAGEGILIDKGVFHSTEALSPEGIFLIESETPVNKKNLIRFDDVYGRTKKRYESGKYVKPRDRSIMNCFYDLKERYDFEKKFGDCHLLILNFPGDDFFRTKINSLKDGVAIILKGKFHNSNGDCLFEHGDLVSVSKFRNEKDICINGEVDLLLIYKK